MNPSTRSKRRFKVHLVSLSSVDASVDITYIEEANDLDELESKISAFAKGKSFRVREIEELE